MPKGLTMFHRRRREDNAFTLLELVVVVVLLGTLAMIAVPRYARFLAEQHIDGAARRLAADLAFAQRSARMASSSQTVRVNVSGDCYTLVGLADPDHAGRDYTVVLSKEPYETSITAINLGGDTDVIFDGYGVPDSGGSVALRVGDTARMVEINKQTGLVTIKRITVAESLPSGNLKEPPVIVP